MITSSIQVGKAEIHRNQILKFRDIKINTLVYLKKCFEKAWKRTETTNE